MSSTLFNTPIYDLIKDKKPLIRVEADITLESLLKTLKHDNVLSVPVYRKGEYCGILDVYTIMMQTSFLDKQSLQETAGEILQRSKKRIPAKIFIHSDPLIKLLKYLCYTDYRAMVVCPDTIQPNSNHFVHQMITQSDVIHFFNQHVDQLGSTIDSKIEELGLVNPLSGDRVVKINSSDSAFLGFVEMGKENISAVAVVDNEGKLIANLSASDVRGATGETLSSVQLPVLEFLEKMHNKKPAVPFSFHVKSHLREIIPAMCIAKIHRVWIVDSAQKPLSVVSMTDVIRSIIPASE